VGHGRPPRLLRDRRNRSHEHRAWRHRKRSSVEGGRRPRRAPNPRMLLTRGSHSAEAAGAWSVGDGHPGPTRRRRLPHWATQNEREVGRKVSLRPSQGIFSFLLFFSFFSFLSVWFQILNFKCRCGVYSWTKDKSSYSSMLKYNYLIIPILFILI
jgi:hypothetical protein